MHRRDANLNPDQTGTAEAAARHSLLRMSSFKWLLIRAFDLAFQSLFSLLPPLRALKNSNAAPEGILVMEYWNLGDLAILVPFLKNLRSNFPKARISLVANPKHGALLEEQGIVDEIIPFPVPWAQHFNRWKKYSPFSADWLSLGRVLLALRKRNFAWAFSGRMDLRDNFFLWLSGARRRFGYGFAGGEAFLTDCVTPDLTRPHRSDIWLRLLEGVRLSPDRSLAHFRMADAELTSAQSYLAALGIPSGTTLVGIHPGARLATRRWGAERFAEIARQLLNKTDAHILWFAEPGDKNESPRLDRCHLVRVGLRHFLSLLSCCRLLICNDSGPMHLANLVSVPVVAVFGPQRPEWFGPRGPLDRVVVRPEFSCRPCFDYCVFDQPYCLRAISPKEVYAAVRSALQGAPNLAQEAAHADMEGDRQLAQTS
jgi:heptosyltransferase II